MPREFDREVLFSAEIRPRAAIHKQYQERNGEGKKDGEESREKF
jgi:hypothetical protein